MKVAIVSSKALQQEWNVKRLISDASTHVKATCPCPVCVHDRLVKDACRAEELFDLDELERFAAEKEKEYMNNEIDDFLNDLSDHPYSCRCAKCWHWWRDMGSDPDSEGYGPFSMEEIESDEPPQPF